MVDIARSTKIPAGSGARCQTTSAIPSRVLRSHPACRWQGAVCILKATEGGTRQQEASATADNLFYAGIRCMHALTACHSPQCMRCSS